MYRIGQEKGYVYFARHKVKNAYTKRQAYCTDKAFLVQNPSLIFSKQ